VGLLRAVLVVEPLQTVPGAGRRWRGQLEVGERRTQIKPGPADDDRRPPRAEDLVDRLVRQALVLRHGAFLVEAEVADEPRRVL
jgi:hypothetical protein